MLWTPLCFFVEGFYGMNFSLKPRPDPLSPPPDTRRGNRETCSRQWIRFWGPVSLPSADRGWWIGRTPTALWSRNAEVSKFEEGARQDNESVSQPWGIARYFYASCRYSTYRDRGYDRRSERHDRSHDRHRPGERWTPKRLNGENQRWMMACG